MMARITKIIRNWVHLFIIALLIITCNPFLALFILFLNYLFSSYKLSNASICFYSSIRIYVEAYIAFYVSLWISSNRLSISSPTSRICFICCSSFTTILVCYIFFSNSYISYFLLFGYLATWIYFVLPCCPTDKFGISLFGFWLCYNSWGPFHPFSDIFQYNL